MDIRGFFAGKAKATKAGSPSKGAASATPSATKAPPSANKDTAEKLRRRGEMEENEKPSSTSESPPAKKAKKVPTPAKAAAAAAPSYKVGDKVYIWYEEEEDDGAWYAGEVNREVAVGLRVTFDMDGSGTIIRTEEFAGRLKPRKAKTAPILGGAASAAAAAPKSAEKKKKPAAAKTAKMDEDEDEDDDDDDFEEDDAMDEDDEEEFDEDEDDDFLSSSSSSSSSSKKKKKAKSSKKPAAKAAANKTKGGAAKQRSDAGKRKGPVDKAAAKAAAEAAAAATGETKHPKSTGAREIKKDEVPDIGSEVKCKAGLKNGVKKWYTAHIVKYDRHGISKKYAVKGYAVVFDRDIPTANAIYPVGSPDILLTGEMRVVRYWSSGTPCMRSTGVEEHAVRTEEEAAALAMSKTKKANSGPVQYVHSKNSVTGKAMARANAKAAAVNAALAEGERPTTEQVTEVFAEIGSDWPTQERPNVTPNGKAVTGFCMGAVYVLGGKGMQTSNVSLAFPELTKCLTSWVRGSLPEGDFPFSSLQINYNYRAKKHVDGNNIGPSYICALGEHDGGGLWTADQYVTSADPKTGETMVKGGGGEAVLDCRNTWKLFNGNAEHETQPMRPVAGKKDLTRISVIVFSNSSYNKLPPYVVEEMEELGFTAQSSDGQDLPYFKRYRIDKKEFSANQNKTYIDYLMQRCEELPPSPLKGRVVIECFGLTMNRGGGWFSFQPDPTGKGDATIVELEPNRTGFHVLELEVTSSQKLVLKNAFVNKTRFDIYKDEKKGTAKFSQWVDSLPEGRIAMITITDTAIAAKRPPGKELYTALQKLGASETMERIGYRQPFAMIGVKGLAPGSAVQAMDKTKILLRMEGTLEKGSGGASTGTVELKDPHIERTDITELMLTNDE